MFCAILKTAPLYVNSFNKDFLASSLDLLFMKLNSRIVGAGSCPLSLPSIAKIVFLYWDLFDWHIYLLFYDQLHIKMVKSVIFTCHWVWKFCYMEINIFGSYFVWLYRAELFFLSSFALFKSTMSLLLALLYTFL